jgi:hypothetical protein
VTKTLLLIAEDIQLSLPLRVTDEARTDRGQLDGIAGASGISSRENGTFIHHSTGFHGGSRRFAR